MAATVELRSCGEGAVLGPDRIEEMFGAVADAIWPALTDAKYAEEVLGLPGMPEAARLLAQRVVERPAKMRKAMRDMAVVAGCARAD